MGNLLTIEVYPHDEVQGEQIDQLIQKTMADEGVRGMVFVGFVMPEVLAKIGINRLPAIVIEGLVVLQGRTPTREDMMTWFDRLVPSEDRAPRHRTDRTGWPSSLDEAVTWLIDEMSDKEKSTVVADNEDLSLTNSGWLWRQSIRNAFGLWAGNRPLMEDCGTDDADEASLVITRAVRDRLKRSMGR